jgi:hypothetical protein
MASVVAPLQPDVIEGCLAEPGSQVPHLSFEVSGQVVGVREWLLGAGGARGADSPEDQLASSTTPTSVPGVRQGRAPARHSTSKTRDRNSGLVASLIGRWIDEAISQR